MGTINGDIPLNVGERSYRPRYRVSRLGLRIQATRQSAAPMGRRVAYYLGVSDTLPNDKPSICRSCGSPIPNHTER